MAKIVVLALSLGILYILIKNQFVHKREAVALDTTNMEKDSICGTYVEESTEHKVKYHDKIYYFCSQECLDKFKHSVTKADV